MDVAKLSHAILFKHCLQGRLAAKFTVMRPLFLFLITLLYCSCSKKSTITFHVLYAEVSRKNSEGLWSKYETLEQAVEQSIFIDEKNKRIILRSVNPTALTIIDAYEVAPKNDLRSRTYACLDENKANVSVSLIRNANDPVTKSMAVSINYPTLTALFRGYVNVPE